MTDIHDIRPPVPPDMDIAWWAVLLIIIAAALALAALWWGWRKFFGRHPEVEIIVPDLPPEMIALSALDALETDLHARENPMSGKSFYFRLSAILRQYAQGRYGIGAPEMTTEEFLPHLDSLPLDPELSRTFKQLCRAMDQVKFEDPVRPGRVAPTNTQMAHNLAFSRHFVHQTPPVPGPSDALGTDEKGV
ncbi:DUF4381 family protein [Desulfosarcina sp. OttesenSCG-928-B08]|nr:DUF4381 family protein [Desulfosarcina sp. OttesenSCG-928-B08]